MKAGQLNAAFDQIDAGIHGEFPNLVKWILAELAEQNWLGETFAGPFLDTYCRDLFRYPIPDGELAVQLTDAKKRKRIEKAWELHSWFRLCMQDQIPYRVTLHNFDDLPEDYGPTWTFVVQQLELRLTPYDWSGVWGVFFAAPFPRLRQVWIEYGQLNDTMLLLLAPLVPQLESLCLRKGIVSAAGLQALFSQPTFQPQRLALDVLSRVSLDQGLERLLGTTHAWWQRLRHLSISNSDFHDAGWPLLKAMDFPFLESLDLSFNRFSNKCLEDWLQSPPGWWLQLKELNLSHTGVEEMVLRWILENNDQTQFRHLHFESDHPESLRDLATQHPNAGKLATLRWA